ncbi:MAG: ATP-binding protein [Calditrichaeota bacterium]|nr:MAG: ATP-binding protein [Calditrichota bacterium]
MREPIGQKAPANRKVYRLELPAASENLALIREFVGGIAENMGFDEETVINIELAVDEACTNVVRHAYNNTTPPERARIRIAVRPYSDRIEITIADNGKGFDPRKLPSPDLVRYVRQMRRGGLGIYLMQKLMDRVYFRIQPGVRNEVRLVKYLSAPGNTTDRASESARSNSKKTGK